jgi:hypothetical protein
MPKLMKALKRKLGIKNQYAEQEKLYFVELNRVWPDGTWNYVIDTGAVLGEFSRWGDRQYMDDTVRGHLLRVWAWEFFQDMQKCSNFQLNPGMVGTYPDPIPKGWKPSEKAMKEYAVKFNTAVRGLHYIVGRLKSLGNLRP